MPRLIPLILQSAVSETIMVISEWILILCSVELTILIRIILISFTETLFKTKNTMNIFILEFW